MSYTAPTGSAVNFSFTDDGYTAPSGDAVNFRFSDATGNAITVAETLEQLTAFASIAHVPVIRLALASTLDELTPNAEFTFNNSRELTFAATLTALQSAAEFIQGRAVTLGFQLQQAELSGQLAWGQKLLSAGLSSSGDSLKTSSWRSARAVDMGLQAGFNDAAQKQHSTQNRWQAGQSKAPEVHSRFSVPPAKTAQRNLLWQAFKTLTVNAEVASHYPEPTEYQQQQRWALSHGQDRAQHPTWNYPLPTDKGQKLWWQHVALFSDKPIWDTRDYSAPQGDAVNFSFNDADYVVPNQTALNFSWGAVSPYSNQPVRPTDAGDAVRFIAPPVCDTGNRVTWGTGSWTRPVPDYATGDQWQTQPDEIPERPPQPNIQGVYIFMPTLHFYRSDDGAEFEAINVSWSTDLDSWAWRFSATLLRDSDLALLKPDANGPREITCEINGHIFRGIVESYGITRQFGKTGYTIKGRSLAAWLSDPYAPKRSRAISTTYTAQQLAALELQNTGWSLDWQTADWQVTGGAWSYQDLDAIAAIKRIADAVGACVRSDPNSQTLSIIPRYPVSPHLWTSTSTELNAILPAALVTQAGAEYSKQPNYNRAISVGGSTGGVIVTLTKNGTAGDELAPVVQNDLITDSAAGYERGRIEIAKGGSWETMTLTGFLTEQGEAPGLLLPGYLVELQDTTETYPVQISGVTINATLNNDALSVRQTIEAERSLNA